MTERAMFYNAKPEIFRKAEWLRKNMTPMEKILWEELRANKLLGLRFKPQHPIDQYIADFYCHKLKLVIEIDGNSHLETQQREYDQGRTYELNQFGIKVMRFRNEEIKNQLDDVLEKIKLECERILSPLQGVGGKTKK